MPWLKWWSSTKDEGNHVESVVAKTKSNLESTAKELQQQGTEIAEQVQNALPSQLEAFAAPQTIIATVLLTTFCLGVYRFYRGYLRRIPEATNISQEFFRKRSIFGKVTAVGDGDNFRLYHTPGGRLAGWGWLPGRIVPKDRKQLKNQTIHVRLAGIDAPELAHFGRPSQPFGQEALEWLTSYINGRRVRAYVYKTDQYSRVVGTAYVWKWFLRRDIGLQMIRAGMATVYEAKTGAEFGDGLEEKYRKAEWRAKTKRKGMWSGNPGDFESPREYKTRHGMGSPDDGSSKK